MDRLRRVTHLPAPASNQPPPPPPNPARDVQKFVGEVMSVVFKPLDLANLGLAKATNWLSNALPSFPAARLFVDMVVGWPHSHPHPPTFGFPLPSIGPVICAGAVNVLINGLPAVRTGDVGFGVWCGGYYPLFEVFTGSSNVFIGGARPARFLIDFTKHCLPGIPGFKGVKAAKKGFKGLSKLDKAMMALPVVLGALGVGAALGDSMGYQEMADSAESESDAKEAAAKSTAAGIEAAMAGLQMAADMAAMALSIGMGKDPGFTPLNCWGKFITGSLNVRIGGLPVPGWDVMLRGLGKLLKRVAKRFRRPRLRDGAHPGACTRKGHPIDVATGKEFDEVTDFVLPGVLPLEIKRFYSSTSEHHGCLGHNWIFSLESCLWEDPKDQCLYIRDQYGRLAPFDLLAVGERSYNGLEKLDLERVAENSYRLVAESLRYVYSSTGRSQHNGFPYPLFRLQSIEDPNGNRITLGYRDGLLREVRDAIGRRLVLSYTDRALLSEIRLVEPEEMILVAYEYDEADDLVAVYDALGNAIRYRYNRHLLVQHRDRAGLNFYFDYETIGPDAWATRTYGDGGVYDVRLDYDVDGKITRAADARGIATYHWNDLGLVESQTASLGHACSFVWDEARNLTSETDALGHTIKQEYDARGNLLSEADAMGRQTRYEYNELDLVTKIVDPVGGSEQFAYDERGNLTSYTNKLGGVWKHTYDARGALIDTEEPNGLKIEQGMSPDWSRIWSRDRYGLIGECRFDKLGRLIAEVDAAGEFCRNEYDALGRLLKSTYRNGHVVAYTYDKEGRITGITHPPDQKIFYRYRGLKAMVESEDTLGHKVRCEYTPDEYLERVTNANGQTLTREINALGDLSKQTWFDGRAESYQYDIAGRVISSEDAAGRITRFDLDPAGNILRILFADGSETVVAYDALDRIVKAVSRGNAIERVFDAAGNILREEQNGGAVEYRYDSMERCIERRIDGHRVEYRYDLRGRLVEVLDDAGSVQQLSYDALNRLVERRFRGDAVERREYDSVGQMIKQQVTDARGNVLVDRQYGWDIAGRLISCSDRRSGGRRYEYDSQGQVIRAAWSGGRQESHTYDGAGNAVTANGVRRRFDGDRLIEAEGRKYTFNGLGQVVEIEANRATTRLSYDCGGSLVSARRPDGRISEYGYDALGRRLWKRSAERLTTYIWDEGRLAYERSGEEVAEYVYFQWTFEPLARWDKNRGWLHYVCDHLGTPQEMIDSAGSLVWAGESSLWGMTAQPINQVPNHLRFAGQYYDEETGLHYNRHRYYDPAIGRYLSPDPIELDGGLNAYAYAQNPVNFIDPFGLEVRRYNSDGTASPTGPYRIELDRQGRPVRATGPAVYQPSAGRPNAPEPIAGGRRFGDDRGHLIAHTLGGPNVRENIVAMNRSVNQNPGAYFEMEKWVRQQAQLHPGKVKMDVRAKYRGNSPRPYAFDVVVTVRGKRYRNPPPIGNRTNRGRIQNPCP
jgi:RHS repeat-associated protein